MLRVWLLAAAIAATTGLLGAGGQAARPALSSDPKPALSATGTIQRFDAMTHLLTIKTNRGSESFVVGDATVAMFAAFGSFAMLPDHAALGVEGAPTAPYRYSVAVNRP